MHYVAADGARIPNLGQYLVKFLTPEGIWATWTFQVAGINKPLVSVSKLIDDHYTVVFDKTKSFIKNKITGEVIMMKRERGVFVVDAYVDELIGATKNEEDFSRRR